MRTIHFSPILSSSLTSSSLSLLLFVSITCKSPCVLPSSVSVGNPWSSNRVSCTRRTAAVSLRHPSCPCRTWRRFEPLLSAASRHRQAECGCAPDNRHTPCLIMKGLGVCVCVGSRCVRGARVCVCCSCWRVATRTYGLVIKPKGKEYGSMMNKP